MEDDKLITDLTLCWSCQTLFNFQKQYELRAIGTALCIERRQGHPMEACCYHGLLVRIRVATEHIVWNFHVYETGLKILEDRNSFTAVVRETMRVVG